MSAAQKKEPAVLITAGPSIIDSFSATSVLPTVNSIVDMPPAAIKAPIDTLAFVVQALINSIAFAIQPTVDAIAFAIQSTVDAITAIIQAVR